MIGDLPRLGAPVHNTGETFTASHGHIICGMGHHAHTYPVTSDTILPGDTATLPVNATGRGRHEAPTGAIPGAATVQS